MRTRFLVLVGFVLAGLPVSSARAQIDWDYTLPGVYLVAQGTNNVSGFRGDPESGVVRTDLDHAFGASGTLGYRFDDHFAVELQGDWESGYKAEVGPSRENEEILGGAVTANLRYYFATEQWQPYALLGLGVGFFEIRHTDVPKLKKTQADLALRFGGGLNLWFNDRIGATLDASYVWPTGASGNIDDLDSIRVGWGFIVRLAR